MFEQLEIKNFENHENLVIDFKPGLNLICGVSNVGKTSIVRALRLVCFNEFTPKSLRVGAKKCRVKLTTDKGFVCVERGPRINEWEVCKNGEEPIKFSKPGTQLVPEVSEVTGFNIISLGNKNIKPNIMDQLEGHFLLAEIEGQTVSGSYRAQILDEISGLSGMEDLIKNINLDILRTSKKIKESEVKVKELETEKHDQNLIDREKKLIGVVNEKVKKARDGYEFSDMVLKLYEKYTISYDTIKETKRELKKLPEYDNAEKTLANAEYVAKKVEIAYNIIKEFSHCDDIMETTKERLKKIPDVKQPEIMLYNANQNCILADKCDAIITEATNIDYNIEELTDKTNNKDKELKVIEKELEKEIKSIDLCPICLKPVHEGCDAFCEG